MFSLCKVYCYLEETLAYTHLPEHRSQFCTHENMTIRASSTCKQHTLALTHPRTHLVKLSTVRMRMPRAGDRQGCCAMLPPGQGTAQKPMSSLQLWLPIQDGANGSGTSQQAAQNWTQCCRQRGRGGCDEGGREHVGGELELGRLKIDYMCLCVKSVKEQTKSNISP